MEYKVNTVNVNYANSILPAMISIKECLLNGVSALLGKDLYEECGFNIDSRVDFLEKGSKFVIREGNYAVPIKMNNRRAFVIITDEDGRPLRDKADEVSLIIYNEGNNLTIREIGLALDNKKVLPW